MEYSRILASLPNNYMTKKIDALLLSAGKSSRMGFTKALVDWHNQKLIQFQVETLLSSGCNNVFIVLGHEKEKIGKLILVDKIFDHETQKSFYPFFIKNYFKNLNINQIKCLIHSSASKESSISMLACCKLSLFQMPA